MDCIFFNPAKIPVMHIGIITPLGGTPKLGAHKTVLPTIPVSTTLSTVHLPAKLHLVLGHITGSHALNNNPQSVGLIKSVHCGPVTIGALSTMLYPSQFTSPFFHVLNSSFLLQLSILLCKPPNSSNKLFCSADISFSGIFLI